MRRRLHTVCLLTIGLVPAFTACGTRATATVQDRSAPLRQPESRFREVRAGDTLYSIAWESGRDYRDIAEWNQLDPPYVIRPGERIRLYPPGGGQRSVRAAAATYHVVRRGDTLYAIAQSAGVRVQNLAAWNSLSPPYVIVPGQRLRLSAPVDAVDRPALANARRGANAKAAAAAENLDTRPVRWRWPTEGKIIARFAPNDGTKGIDIAGRSGQAVRAAAGGKVVYQGSGLRGYGQLIIVKHNADFLSAYAHCAAIYVREGSVIQPGQKIAAMGSSGTDRVKLHFEIRRRGIPVDPLEHLPKK